MSPPIKFFFDETRIGLKNRAQLRFFLTKQIRKAGRKLESLNFIFCSDHTLKQMNYKHLGHNYFTDIITFDLSSGPQAIQAEIYISADRVRDNARNFETTITIELHRVIFHGVLHLLGYQDKSPNQKLEMRKMEASWLNKYFKR